MYMKTERTKSDVAEVSPRPRRGLGFEFTIANVPRGGADEKLVWTRETFAEIGPGTSASRMDGAIPI